MVIEYLQLEGDISLNLQADYTIRTIELINTLLTQCTDTVN